MSQAIKHFITPWLNGRTFREVSIPDRKQAKIDEDHAGRQLLNANSPVKQWAGQLGEKAVFYVLNQGGKNPRRARKIISKYRPDWETDDAVWEVKTRTWCTSGTAGEKVLAVPYKYADIPVLYGKPLKIVLVGYQEWEYSHGGTIIFDDINKPSTRQQKMLDFWKEMGIEFVKFSDLVQELPAPSV